MSRKTKQKIALAVDNVMSDVVEVVSEVENVVLTLVEQFIKLFDYVDEVVLCRHALIKDTEVRRSTIASYLLKVAHEKKLLDSIKSTSTFREKFYALIQDAKASKSKKLFDDNKRLENVISKRDCLKFLKENEVAKTAMLSMYSNMKYVQKFYDVQSVTL